MENFVSGTEHSGNKCIRPDGVADGMAYGETSFAKFVNGADRSGNNCIEHFFLLR